jgi:hypothetical protein
LPDSDAVPAAFRRAHPKAHLFVRGTPGASIWLAVEPRRLHVVFDGEPDGACLTGVFAEARDAGLLTNDMWALVDITRFTGAIDWKAISALGEIMPKGGDTINRNAYIVRDGITAAMTKISAALFTRTQHQPFSNEAEAREWLGWEAI